MADYGLLGGIGSGLQAGFQAYVGERRRQDETRSNALAKALQMKTAGLQMNATGDGYDETPEKQLKTKLENEYLAQKREREGQAFSTDQEFKKSQILKNKAEAFKLRSGGAKTGLIGEKQKEDAGPVVQDIGRSLEMTKNPLSSGAFVGQTSGIPGAPAWQLNQMLESVKANIGFDKLSAMRAASKTGAALGSISDKETALLQATAGKLDPRLPTPMLEDNLKRISNQYNDIIHGKGNGPERFSLSFDDQGRPIKAEGGPKPGEYKDQAAPGFLQGYGDMASPGSLTDSQAAMSSRLQALTSGDRGGFLDNFNDGPSNPDQEALDAKEYFENRDQGLLQDNPGAYRLGQAGAIATDAAAPIAEGVGLVKAGAKGLLNKIPGKAIGKWVMNPKGELVKAAGGLVRDIVKEGGKEIVKESAKKSAAKVVKKSAEKLSQKAESAGSKAWKQMVQGKNKERFFSK